MNYLQSTLPANPKYQRGGVYFFKFPLEDETLGGADFHALKLAKYFSARGREVKLFTSDKKIFRLFERHALPRKRIFIGWEPTSKKSLILWPITYLLARIRLAGLLKNLEGNNVFLLLGLTEKLILTPLLLNHQGAHQNKILWLEHKIPGSWLKKNPLRFRYLKLANQARLITVSKFTKEEFVQFGVNRENLTIIYPGAAPSSKNQKFPINKEGEYVIGVLGRLDSEKGVLDFLKAISVKLKNSPTWQILIAGEGRERTGMEEFIRDSGLQNQVQILGFVNDLDRFFSEVSVLAYPSQTRESFGLSVLEAMTRGVPVVASKIGALPEIIGEREHSFLVPLNHPEEWVTCLEKLADSSHYLKASRHSILSSQKFSDSNFFSAFTTIF